MGDVVGYCPMGCGQTLFLGSGGHITCSSLRCTRPTAVDELLDDNEPEHIVQLDEETFTVRHPLREHHDDALMVCLLHEWIASRSGRPAQPGRYRVIWRAERMGRSEWQRIGCCDFHGRNCEPPSELCCYQCTEATHPAHADGTVCSAPDLSGTGVAAGTGEVQTEGGT